MKIIYQAVARALARRQPAILARVVASSGSTPRKTGASMAIFQGGSAVGSVGGGPVEAAVVKQAAALWAQKGALLAEFSLHAGGSADSGIVCGGRQKILTVMLPATPAVRELFGTLAQEGAAGVWRYWLTVLKGEGPRYFDVTVGRLDRHGGSPDLSLNTAAQGRLRQAIDQGQLPIFTTVAGDTYLAEEIMPQGTVYLFGSGHVARPTLALASQAGFGTVLLDDRPDFANRQYFPHSDKIIILEKFAGALAGLSLDADAYLILVTRSHHHDQTLLAQALATPAAYIGMIGSRRKVAACFANLQALGWREKDLARVHTPIGLDIGADTPEEIAVSIVAQLIQVRSRMQGRKFRSTP